MRLIAAAETDRGIVKDSNQDSLCFELAETSRGSAALAIVCDGMGGLQKGEVASAAVTRQFSNWFETEFPRQFEAFDWRSASAQWEHMIQVAAQKLADYGASNGVRLGTTVSAMLIYENHYLMNILLYNMYYMLNINNLNMILLKHSQTLYHLLCYLICLLQFF